MKTGTLLVGVDGSLGSAAALRWALKKANLRSASVRVVHTWELSKSFGPDVYMTPDIKRYRASAHDVLDECITTACEGITPLPEIAREVFDRAASRVLIVESGESELVVVGSRGHGGFIGLLLGSVATQVAHHSKCPVVVVPVWVRPRFDFRFEAGRGALGTAISD